MIVDADGKIILKRRSPEDQALYYAQKIVAFQRENTDMRETLEHYYYGVDDAARACLARWPQEAK